jgi:hypothetical protein|tara:strand:- start:631 stop:996 length:366 start_codon:yes stop_codon:yes gene_type:complete
MSSFNLEPSDIKDIFKPIEQTPNYNWRRGSPYTYFLRSIEVYERNIGRDVGDIEFLVEKFFKLPLEYLLIDLFIHTSIGPIDFLGKIDESFYMSGYLIDVNWLEMEAFLQDRYLYNLTPPK